MLRRDLASADSCSGQLIAADQPHQIIVAAALARNRKGSAHVRIIATEPCRQIIKINPEASDAGVAERIEREAMIEKISQRLNEHDDNSHPATCCGCVSGAPSLVWLGLCVIFSQNYHKVAERPASLRLRIPQR